MRTRTGAILVHANLSCYNEDFYAGNFILEEGETVADIPSKYVKQHGLSPVHANYIEVSNHYEIGPVEG